MSHAATAIRTEAFSVLRDDEPVFQPVSFKLDFGQVGCLSGANGSGKSTLLRALAGLPHEASGSAVVLPQVDSDSDRLEFIGHRSGMSARLTCLENLTFYASMVGVDDQSHASAALERVGLMGWSEEQVRHLSAGQKRRVALARLLVSPANLWLLDEPMANLDTDGQNLVNELITEHTERGHAVLLSSHQSRTADMHCVLA